MKHKKCQQTPTIFALSSWSFALITTFHLNLFWQGVLYFKYVFKYSWLPNIPCISYTWQLNTEIYTLFQNSYQSLFLLLFMNFKLSIALTLKSLYPEKNNFVWEEGKGISQKTYLSNKNLLYTVCYFFHNGKKISHPTFALKISDICKSFVFKRL